MARSKAKAKPAGARAATVTELRKQLAVAQREIATRDKALARATALVAELDAAPKPTPPPAALADFKNPPTDPLHAQAELHRMVVVSAYDAAADATLTAEQRRKEIRTITSTAAKLFPESRRWKAEQMIKADRHELDKKASERRGAKLEKLRR